MRLFGFEITRQKQMPPSAFNTFSPGGWTPLIQEPFAGAWQRNIAGCQQNVIEFPAVYACVKLIAQDIAKLRIKLMVQGPDGIWTETVNPAFSPVLRKPNHYQTRIQFLEQWVTSKLIWGNSYIIKERDNRSVVTGMYVLDPFRVRPLVAPNGDVFYSVNRDPLAQVTMDEVGINAIPASEIIHDVMLPLYHPLCGISPISACGLAALQGLRMQASSAAFFGNGATPNGILTSPIPISEEQSRQMQKQWQEQYGGTSNSGKVAVLGNGVKYEQLTMSAVDAQLSEQLKGSAELVCTALGVPAYMVGVGPAPAYNNVDALNTQYYTQTLQNLIECIELLLDEGLGMAGGPEVGNQVLGTELDLDELMRMDTATRIKAAADAITGGGMSPNEARERYHGLGPVPGGENPYLQQQNFSLEALAKRDAQADPFAGPARPAPVTTQPTETVPSVPAKDMGAQAVNMLERAMGIRRRTAA